MDTDPDGIDYKGPHFISPNIHIKFSLLKGWSSIYNQSWKTINWKAPSSTTCPIHTFQQCNLTVLLPLSQVYAWCTLHDPHHTSKQLAVHFNKASILQRQRNGGRKENITSRIFINHVNQQPPSVPYSWCFCLATPNHTSEKMALHINEASDLLWTHKGGLEWRKRSKWCVSTSASLSLTRDRQEGVLPKGLASHPLEFCKIRLGAIYLRTLPLDLTWYAWGIRGCCRESGLVFWSTTAPFTLQNHKPFAS